METSASRDDATYTQTPFVVASSRHAHLRYASLGLAFFIWTAIYSGEIFNPPLLDDVATIHAEAAREMVLRHDWVTLYTDGIRYLEKAPLMYWGVAASYELF